MLQLRNLTPFEAGIMLLPDAEGVDTVYAVTKGSFDIGPTLTLADEQMPLALADTHYGDAATTSVRIPSDVGLGKRGTDVLVIGSARAPRDEPTWQLDVSISVHPLTKRIRVFADRVWDVTAGAATITWLTPFIEMPLVWERAYGGTDNGDRGPFSEPRNPVGVGFRAPGTERPLAGQPLPNLEDQTELITSPGQAPPPAGLGAIAPHWRPRRDYAGTYDEAWQRHRAPFLPTDFDHRFFHVAPIGLTTIGTLDGGEQVTLSGVASEGSLQFTLPRLSVQTVFALDSAREQRAAMLETMLIDVDRRRLTMTWRSGYRCDKKALRVREIVTTVNQSG